MREDWKAFANHSLAWMTCVWHRKLTGDYCFVEEWKKKWWVVRVDSSGIGYYV